MGTELLTGIATAHVSLMASGMCKLASRQDAEGQHHDVHAYASSTSDFSLTESLSSCTVVKPNPTQDLVASIQAAFSAEKALGHAVNASQPIESFLRLDETVRGLLQQYSSSHMEAWRRYEFFNDLHYVRNLVDECEDFELIVSVCPCKRGTARSI